MMNEWKYDHGFTRGLLKSREIISYICDDMKMHKRRITEKELKKVLDVAIQEREKLRENPFAFIRCVEGGYELFEESQDE